jgi:hypothetical protein
MDAYSTARGRTSGAGFTGVPAAGRMPDRMLAGFTWRTVTNLLPKCPKCS